MKVVRIACLAVAMLAVAAVCSQAADDKEVKLTGTMVCGKCTLKLTDKCTNVLQVKDGDKTVNYFITDDGPKAEYHKPVCPGGAKTEGVTVTGVVTKKDDMMWIKGKVALPK
jgi:type 1 fimbria pilin